jgi:hypothetical protein
VVRRRRSNLDRQLPVLPVLDGGLSPAGYRRVYRGLYQWDGAQEAENYARALWRVLALVSVPGSIRYHVLPGLLRDDLLHDPLLAPTDEAGAWWRLTTAPASVT